MPECPCERITPWMTALQQRSVLTDLYPLSTSNYPCKQIHPGPISRLWYNLLMDPFDCLLDHSQPKAKKGPNVSVKGRVIEINFSEALVAVQVVFSPTLLQSVGAFYSHSCPFLDIFWPEKVALCVLGSPILRFFMSYNMRLSQSTGRVKPTEEMKKNADQLKDSDYNAFPPWSLKWTTNYDMNVPGYNNQC